MSIASPNGPGNPVEYTGTEQLEYQTIKNQSQC